MRALISVYDKNGLDKFCKTLDSLGYEIYSTGGTLDYIKKIGIDAFSISDVDAKAPPNNLLKAAIP